MPKIPTFRRRRVPSGRIGAAPISPRAAHVSGEAVGRGEIVGQQGLDSLGRDMSSLGTKIQWLEEKRQQMTDANSSVTAEQYKKLDDAKYEQFKAVNPQEEWVGFRQQQAKDLVERVGQLNFSPAGRQQALLKADFDSQIAIAGAETDSLLQLKKDTIETQTSALAEAYRSQRGVEEAESRYLENAPNMGYDEHEAIERMKSIKATGDALRVDDAEDIISEFIRENPTLTEAEQQAGIDEIILTATDDQTDKDDLYRHAKSVIDLNDLDKATASKEYKAEINNQAYEKYNDGDYAGAKEIVDDSELGATDKLSWDDRINRKIAADLRLAEAETAKSRSAAQREVNKFEFSSL